jgi:hypothetical protein
LALFSRFFKQVVLQNDASPLHSRARLIDGALRRDVMLGLDARGVSYSGVHARARMDLKAIDSVEYGCYFAAAGIPHGTLLRLTSLGSTLVFVLDESAAEWARRLPQRTGRSKNLK